MSTFVLFHVVISLIAIATGFVVLAGLLRGQRLDAWTAIFLVTTIATSVTGYGIPADRLLPSHVVGALSLVVLALALYARYGARLAGGWRWAYVISATIALYFNVFVGVVQAFLRVPALRAAAPRQNEPPFVAAQSVVLLLFIGLGWLATKRFRSGAPAGPAVVTRTA